MKTKILSMLRKQETYVSGQEMCKELGVSRTAVWKCMNQLKEEGYTIEAISNKGYRLVESPDTLTSYEILSRLEKSMFEDVLFFEKIDSTNNKAKELGNQLDRRQLIIVADAQTAGRGRRGRTWQSPKGTDIFMSFKLHPAIAPQHASRITLVAALAVVSAIETVTGLEAKIKWPNDIIVNGHKVCGILTEMSSEPDFIHHVVVGIGINVNTETFPEEIANIATSLYHESKQTVNRATLLVEVVAEFERFYEQFLKTEDLSMLVDEYNGYLVHKGKEIRVISGREETIGMTQGIDHEGSLLVMMEDGVTRPVISGEVSIRGISSYV